MKTAADILRQKAKSFNYIMPDTSVQEATRLLISLNRSFLIVMEGNAYRGIFTEHAYVRFASQHPLQHGLLVGEVMETKLPAADVRNSIQDLLALMMAHHTRYIPVFDGYRFEGVVTMNNLLKAMLLPSFGMDDYSSTNQQGFDTAMQG